MCTALTEERDRVLAEINGFVSGNKKQEVSRGPMDDENKCFFGALGVINKETGMRMTMRGRRSRQKKSVLSIFS